MPCIRNIQSYFKRQVQLINFYDSELGQAIYSWRRISVEPLIEHIKDVFKIDPLPVRGCQKAVGIGRLSVLIYQIMVYYNCITGNKQPKAIKHMLGSESKQKINLKMET